MRVDNRFKVLPYCCFNADLCDEYLGHNGYFGNDIEDFKCMDLCKYGTLEKIYCDQAEPFQMKEDRKDYKHFIPEFFVIQKEKEFRPYTLEEFSEKFTIGRPVKFRKKGDVKSEQLLILNGYRNGLYNDQMVTWIYFGPFAYTLVELFEDFEWQAYYNEDFEPFGVEEN